MSEKLNKLIEEVRHYQMSDKELDAQAISFAYGNVHYENKNTTREGITRESRRLTESDGPKSK